MTQAEQRFWGVLATIPLGLDYLSAIRAKKSLEPAWGKYPCPVCAVYNKVFPRRKPEHLLAYDVADDLGLTSQFVDNVVDGSDSDTPRTVRAQRYRRKMLKLIKGGAG